MCKSDVVFELPIFQNQVHVITKQLIAATLGPGMLVVAMGNEG